MSKSAGPRAPIHAITFDLDFTLWDLSGVIVSAEQHMRAYLSRHYPRTVEHFDSPELAARRRALLEREPGLRHNVTRLRQAVLGELARLANYGETLVEEAFNVFLDARHDVVPYEDAIPVLESLQGRYRLGVVTNGNADVRRLAIGEFFDFRVSAVDVGATKPDRVIFEAACHRAQAEPEAVLHVGDDPEADIVGAAEYGMQAVWLNRDARPWPEELPPVPHWEVRSLFELRRRLTAPATTEPTG